MTTTRPAGHPPVVVTIAGSDPSGGAGIQADLKTFSALGAYGCAVLTALTAQNTRGVSGVFPIPAAFVRDQLVALTEDVALDAVKIGMVADADIAAAIADILVEKSLPAIVLDPVMVATSGHRLLDPAAEQVLRTRLLPIAHLITPNTAEAAVLLGVPEAGSTTELADQARRLRDLGARRVLLKGGHLGTDRAVDMFCDSDGSVLEVTAQRVHTKNTHGTGCTLSSAIAALRPGAPDWSTAIAAAKDYLTTALRHADELRIGRVDEAGTPLGHGPVHHFAAVWTRPDDRADEPGQRSK